MYRILIIAHFLLCLVACAGGDLEQAGQVAPELGVEAPTNMNILVIGGTSGIGLETVKLALDRGHNVTAMSRRPERMALTHERLATVKGDVSSSEMVENAIAGHDAVVFTIGIGPTRKPVSVFSDGIRTTSRARMSPISFCLRWKATTTETRPYFFQTELTPH
jgi:NADPH:quinone reductase-like Zn-dependent oxidoreductase